MNDESPLDQNALGSFSKRLATAVFVALADTPMETAMVRDSEADGQSLIVRVPSPSGDQDRCIWIWVDEVVTPSIGFGPGHTHGSADDEGISETTELCRAILDDEMVIIEDVGGQYDGHSKWLDLRDPEALTEDLTSQYSPGSARLKSWSGKADRMVGLEDF
jgi:hypothetical protein